jgi:error-prone DNA polymerase
MFKDLNPNELQAREDAIFLKLMDRRRRLETADGQGRRIRPRIVRKSGLAREPKPVPQAREIFVRDLHSETLKIKSRNFQ